MYLYQLTGNLPRTYKYTLGQNILDLAWQTLDHIILANSLPNNKKTTQIIKASANFDQLKTRLRMAHELKLISHKQQARLIVQNEEIGKMLSGWLRWARNQVSKT